MRIRLKGRNQRGKALIKAQGDLWKVIDTKDSITTIVHAECSGPFALIRRDCDIRWVSLKDDPYFIVKEIDEMIEK